MGMQQQMFWTLVGCGAWLLCDFGLTTAIPIVTGDQTPQTEPFPTDFLLWGTEGDYFDATTLMTTERSAIVTAPLQTTEQFASAPLGPGGTSGENRGANSSSPVEAETSGSEPASAEGNGDSDSDSHNGELAAAGETGEGATETPVASGEASADANSSKSSLATEGAESTTAAAAEGKATSAVLLPEETPAPFADVQPESTEPIKDTYSRVTDAPLPAAGSEEKISESPFREEGDIASSTFPPSAVEGETLSDTVAEEATVDDGLKPTVAPREEPAHTDLGPSGGLPESSTDAHGESAASAVLPDSAEEISKTSSTVSPSLAEGEETSDTGTAETDPDNGLTPTVAPREEPVHTDLGPSGGLPESSTDAHGASAIPATLPSNSEELLPEEADATPAPGLSRSLPSEDGAEEVKQTAPSELPPSGVTSLSNVETPLASVPEGASSASQSETPEGGDIPAGLDDGTAPPPSLVEETAGSELSGGQQPLVTSTQTPSRTVPSSSKAVAASSASLSGVPSGPSSSENQGGQPSLRPPPGSLSPQSSEAAESSKGGEEEGNNPPSDAASSRENSSLPLDSNAAGAQSQVPAGTPGPKQSPPVGASAAGHSALEEAKELEDSSGNGGKEPSLDAPSAESQSGVPSSAAEGTGSASGQESPPSPGDAASTGNESSKASEDVEGSSGTRGEEVPPGSPDTDSQTPGVSAEETSSGLGTGGSPPSEENTSPEEADSEGSQTSPDEASTTGSRGSPGVEESEGFSGASALDDPDEEPQSPGTSLTSTVAPEPAASEEAEEFDGLSKDCGEETELGSPAAESGGFGNGRACHFTLAAESARLGSAADQPSQPSTDDEPVVGSGISEGAEGSDVSSSPSGKKIPSVSSAVEPQAPDTSASGEVSEAVGNGRQSPLPEEEEIPSSGSTGDRESQPSPDGPTSTGPAASEEAEEEEEVTSELGQKENPSEVISEGLENEKPSTSSGGVKTDDSESGGNQGSQTDEAAASDGTEEPEGSSGVSGKETPQGAESPSTGDVSGGLTPDEVENTAPEKEGSEGPQTSPSGASAVGPSAPESPAGSQVTDEAPENGTPSADSDAESQSLGTSTGDNSGGLLSGTVSNSSEGVENPGPEEANSEGSQVSSGDATAVGPRVSEATEEPEGTNQASANGAPLVSPDGELQSLGTSRGDTPGDLGNGLPLPDGVENGPEKAESDGSQTSPDDAAGDGTRVSDAPEESDSTNKPNANGIPSANSNAPEIPEGTAETSVNGVPLVDSDAAPQSAGASGGDASGDLGNGNTSDSTNGVENTGPPKEDSEGPQTSPGDASEAAPEAPADSQVTDEAPGNGTPLADSDAEPQSLGTSTGDNSGSLSGAGVSSSPAGVENTVPPKEDSEGPQPSSGDASAGAPEAPADSQVTDEAPENGTPLADSDAEPQSLGTSTGDNSGSLSGAGVSSSPAGVENTVPPKEDSEGPQPSSGDASAGAPEAPADSQVTDEAPENGTPLADSDAEPQSLGTSTGDNSGSLSGAGVSSSPAGVENTAPPKEDSEGPQTSPGDASAGAPEAPADSQVTDEAPGNGTPLADSDAEPQSLGTSTGDNSGSLSGAGVASSPAGVENTAPPKEDSEGPQTSPGDASAGAPEAPADSQVTDEAPENGTPLADSDAEPQSLGTSTGDNSGSLSGAGVASSPAGVENTAPPKEDSAGTQTSPGDASAGAPETSADSQVTDEAPENGTPLADSDAEPQSLGTSTGDNSGSLSGAGVASSPAGVENTAPPKEDSEGPQTSPGDASAGAPEAPADSQVTDEAPENRTPLADSDAEPQSLGTSTGGNSGSLSSAGVASSPAGVENTAPPKEDSEGPQTSPGDASAGAPEAPADSQVTDEAPENGTPLADSVAEPQSLGTSTGDNSGSLSGAGVSSSPAGVENTGREEANSDGSQVSTDDASTTGSRVSAAPKESEGTNETSVNGAPLSDSDAEPQTQGTSTGDSSGDLGNGRPSSNGVESTSPEKAEGEGSQTSPDDTAATDTRATNAPELPEGTAEASANGVPLGSSDAEPQSSGSSRGETSGDLGTGSTSSTPNGVENTGAEEANSEGSQAPQDEASATGPRVSAAPKESEGTSETSANGAPLANSDGQSTGTSGGDTSGGLGNGNISDSPNGVESTGQEKADSGGSQTLPDDSSAAASRLSNAPKILEGPAETSANGGPLANSEGQSQSTGTSGGDTSGGNGNISNSPNGVESTGQEKADSGGSQTLPDDSSAAASRLSNAPKILEGPAETSANGGPLANSEGQSQSTGTSGGDTSGGLGNGNISDSPNGVESTGQEKADSGGSQTLPDDSSAAASRLSNAPKILEGPAETSANGGPLANSEGQSQSTGTSGGDTSGGLGNGNISDSPNGVESTGQEKADSGGSQTLPDDSSAAASRLSNAPKILEGPAETSANGGPLANSEGQSQSTGTSGGDTSGGLGNGNISDSPNGVESTGQEKTDSGGSQTLPDDSSAAASRLSNAPKILEGPAETSANGGPLANSEGQSQSTGTSGGDTSGGLGNGNISNSPNGVESTGQEKADSGGSQTLPGDSSAAASRLSNAPKILEGPAETSANGGPLANSEGQSQSTGTSGGDTSGGLGNGNISDSPNGVESTGQEKADSGGSQTLPDDSSAAASRLSNAPKILEGPAETSANGGPLANSEGQSQSTGTSGGDTSGGLGNGNISDSPNGVESTGQEKADSGGSQTLPDDSSAAASRLSNAPKILEGPAETSANGGPLANSEGQSQSTGTSGGDTSGGLGNGNISDSPNGVESTGQEKADSGGSQTLPDDSSAAASRLSNAPKILEGPAETSANGGPLANSEGQSQSTGTSGGDTSGGLGNGNISDSLNGVESTGQEKADSGGSQTLPDDSSAAASRLSNAPKILEGPAETSANGGPLANSEGQSQSTGTSGGDTSGGLGNGNISDSPNGVESTGQEKADSGGSQTLPDDSSAAASRLSNAPKILEGPAETSANGGPLANSEGQSQSTGTSGGDTSGGLGNGNISDSPNGVESTGQEKADSGGSQTLPDDSSAAASRLSNAPKILEGPAETSANGGPLANSEGQSQSTGTSGGDTSGGLGNGNISNSPNGVESTGQEKADSGGSQTLPDDSSAAASRLSNAPKILEGPAETSANGGPLANSEGQSQSTGTSGGDTSGGLGNGNISDSPNGVESTGQEKADSGGPETLPDDSSAAASRLSNAPKILEGPAETSANGGPLANSEGQSQSTGTSGGDTSGGLGNGNISASPNGVESTGQEKADSGGSQTLPDDSSAAASRLSNAPKILEGPAETSANGGPLANSEGQSQSTGTSGGDTSGGLGNGNISDSPNGVESTGQEKTDSGGSQTLPDDSSAAASRLSNAPKILEGPAETSANGGPLANSEGQSQSTGTSGGDTSGGLGNGNISDSPNGVESTGQEKADSGGSQTLPDDSSAAASRLSNAPKILEGPAETSANGGPSGNSEGQSQSTGTSGGDTSGGLGNGNISDSPNGVESTGQEKADSGGSQVSPDEVSATGPRLSPAPKESDGTSETSANGGPLANSDGQSTGTSGGDTSGDLGNGNTSNSPNGVESTGQEKADSEGSQTSSDAAAAAAGSRVSKTPEESEGNNEASESGAPSASSEAEPQSPGSSAGENPAGLNNGKSSSFPDGVENSGPGKTDSGTSQTSPDEASATGSQVSNAPKESVGTNEVSPNAVPLANSDGELKSPGKEKTSGDLGKEKSEVKGKGGKSSDLKGAEAVDGADQKSSPSNLVSSGSKTGKPGSDPDSPSPSHSSSASKSDDGEKKGKETKAPPTGNLDARLASSRVAPEETKSSRTSNKPSDKKSGSGHSKDEKPAAANANAANSGRAGIAFVPAPSVSLLPYGPNAKDKEYVERKPDFNSPRFKPEIGVPLGKTLHDSLHYTDNGQIIFPASDKDASSYPNPLPQGFNGREQLPMIAVFWDNADFSKGSGTTFYQEYVTQKSATHPVVRDIEGKIRQYVEPSFWAKWTLKITWVKAQPYPAQKQDTGTNTYQAVLTTDGYTAYALFLYQDGGMRWDYTKLAATNVLIGYTSGDGFFRTDDLMKKTPAEKYRPDQVKGYNTDVRGLWIYKLDSRIRINYRQRCLDWIDHESEPSVWNKDLPSCPCSLEQGVSDGRYTRSKTDLSGSHFTMLSSSTPNPYGSGVRCLYGDNNQLLEGRQERIWRDVQKKDSSNDEELKFYDWCCNRVGSQQVCDKYSQKRPKISCDGYRPPARGTPRKETLKSESEEERD